MMLDQHENKTNENNNVKKCNHGIIFDEEKAKDLSASEIRKQFPRLFGKCPLDCGFEGIGYASFKHYVMGDW